EILLNQHTTHLNVIAQQSIKHLSIVRVIRFIKYNRNQSTRFRGHSRLPHHVRIIFTKTLRTLNLNLVISISKIMKLIQNFILFIFIIRKVGFLCTVNLKQRSQSYEDSTLLQQRRTQSINERYYKATYLATVCIGICCDYNLSVIEFTNIKLG